MRLKLCFCCGNECGLGKPPDVGSMPAAYSHYYLNLSISKLLRDQSSFVPDAGFSCGPKRYFDELFACETEAIMPWKKD